jgi:hypothetical protein
VGTALGTLVVATLLDLSWPMRIALIALVLVVGLGYVGWKNRAAIAAGAAIAQEPQAAAGALDATDGEHAADAGAATGPVGRAEGPEPTTGLPAPPAGP